MRTTTGINNIYYTLKIFNDECESLHKKFNKMENDPDFCRRFDNLVFKM